MSSSSHGRVEPSRLGEPTAQLTAWKSTTLGRWSVTTYSTPRKRTAVADHERQLVRVRLRAVVPPRRQDQSTFAAIDVPPARPRPLTCRGVCQDLKRVFEVTATSDRQDSRLWPLADLWPTKPSGADNFPRDLRFEQRQRQVRLLEVESRIVV